MKYDFSEMLFFGLICVSIIFAGYGIYEHQSYLNDLKNGNKIAVCNLRDTGPTVIDPSKIVDVDIDSHTIIFTNGWASSCEVENK